MTRVALVLFASVVLGTSVAQAQDVIVIVPEAGAATLDLARVEARVRAETGAVVRVGPVAEGTAVVVRVEGDARAVVVLVRSDGTRMERAAEVPDDPAERAEIVAILAVNMLHDESSELLALLAPPPPPPVVVVADPPAVDPPVEAPPADEAPVVVPVLPPEPLPPGEAFLRLGLSGHLTSTPHGAGVRPDFFAGLELAWTPLPFFAVGVRDLGGGGSTQDDLFHADGAPFAELGLPIEWLTLHVDLGAHLQALGSPRGFEGIGVAPFGLVGARFRLVREVSIGLETTIRGVASDAFLSGIARLPQGAVVWSAGLSLLFHVS